MHATSSPPAPHYTGIRTRDPEEFLQQLGELRFAKLSRQIAYCFEHSDFYRGKLRAAGVSAPSDIRSLDDFRRLPALITKDEHRAIQLESLEREGHSFGTHLCAPRDRIIHVAATSGTTGNPTFYTFTRKDLDIALKVFGRLWQYAGLRPGDAILHANGLSMWLGGLTAILSFQAYGLTPIPVGAEAGVARILHYLRLTRPRAMICTPSLARHLIERAPGEIGTEVGALGLRKLLVGGEPGGGLPTTRQALADAYGAEVYDLTGGAWHNGTISPSGAQYHGMHSFGDDYCFRYDLVDPATRQPIELTDGAVGEAIHTALEYEAGPALRYATGDILRIRVGECPQDGHFGVRIELLGRADDLLIVKGIKVYPAAIKEIIDGMFPRCSGHFRIDLDTPPPMVEPPLRLTVELGEHATPDLADALATELAARMHAQLSIRPNITFVPFASLPRSSGKTKVIHVAGMT